MVVYARAANKGVLRWARERSGRSRADVAKILRKDEAVIASWEEPGDAWPTYVQLERLAEQVYKLPLAVFFFPEPPREALPDPEFRTLPDAELRALIPDTRFAVREARALQESLQELTEGTNPAASLVFRDMRAYRSEEITRFCRRLRAYLGIDMETQASWASDDQAFKAWRQAVEGKGVFVLKRSFEDKDFSGFCLQAPTFPVICINNGTPFTRQSFTLFHELAHILFEIDGVTMMDASYVDALAPRWRNVEVRCNKIAAEILVPSDDFETQISLQRDPKAAVVRLANRYRVSREVILRRLRDRDLVSQREYEHSVAEWNRQMAGRGGEGGNYYATKAAYLGDSFLRLAFSAYHDGRCTLPELAEHLQVKAMNVEKLEAFLVGRRG